MGVKVVHATVTAAFTYTEVDGSGRHSQSVSAHQISVRVKLTNSPVGQKLYAATQSADPGELAPAGLAQTIFTSLQTLQYEGTHRIIDPGFKTVSPLVGPKNILQLFGGAIEWGVMDSTIQQVDFDFFSTSADISFGPVKHLSPGDLEELLQFWRWRTVYDNPNLRISGQQSQTQGHQVGGDTATENTTQGNAPFALHTIQSGPPDNTILIQHDAPNAEIRILNVDRHSAPLAGASKIFMSLDDVSPDDVPRVARFRLLRFKDANDGCNPKKCYVMMTDPEADT
jgi:hypothetical protein